MWWIIGLTFLVLVGLSAWYGDDRRENLREAVLAALRDAPGSGLELLARVAGDALGRTVAVYEVHGVLTELREYGLAECVPNDGPDPQPLMVWRAVKQESLRW